VPLKDADGKIFGLVGMGREITERKRAEQALARERDLLNALMDNIPDKIYFKDTQSRFVRINRAYAEIVGFGDPAQAIGKTDFDFFTEEHARQAYEDEQRIIRTGQPIVGLIEKETWPDRLDTWVSTTKMPLCDEKGNIVGTFGISRDITERKRAEEKLATKVTELEQRNTEIALLNEMDDLLQTCLTTQEAYTVVAQAAQKLFPNESGALCIIAPSRNFVEAVATWGESLPLERVFVPDDCWALRRGQAHRVVDPRSGLLCRHISQPLPAGYVCMPMMAQGETLGILHLQSGKPSPSQTEEELETRMASQQRLVVALAEHIALALANLRLRDALRSQAIRDPLTGLFNRRYMEETLERELRRAERRQVKLGLILFDLDHFKKFNDIFGHAAGDVVLREIGTFLQTRVRAEDIACRYGGEEFVVILPEASLEDTLRRAEQLREGIKRLHVRYHDQALGAVTVSLGVAILPEHGSTTEAIMKSADAALYCAKREGRDRVVVASDTSG
jgi:diguanylate cyclase (GGDEF)-like protein/PAS domain S-box-containing protein